MTEKVIAVFVDYVDHFTETYMTEVEIWEEAIIEIQNEKCPHFHIGEMMFSKDEVAAVGTRECAFQFIK